MIIITKLRLSLKFEVGPLFIFYFLYCPISLLVIRSPLDILYGAAVRTTKHILKQQQQ